MKQNRGEIADFIFNNLKNNQKALKNQFDAHKKEIGYFYLDNLLPKELALEIYKNFPSTKASVQRKSIREYKFTAFQMNKYHCLLEETIFAFQDKRIVNLIAKICEIEKVSPDSNLYAGGLSLMKKDNFLNPHLDNSHDKDRHRWRVLNLLYYVTPNWKLENGGNLELWPKGLNKKPITITSKFNRLVVMATHQKSWHSVNKVLVNDVRCCVSNYYFSEEPLLASDHFHVTTFRARPEEKLKDFVLQIDNKLRSAVRKLFKKGVRENPHQYKK
ncbi:2OG-Fe(II) oxygenase [Polaribacter batillariae]|uniref:2OG-Fe(II) oxygenase n=1 Tax=Polaribacter batillariae TaxID=2808900 RepID=A0ABX7ST18_9FLAO|nr:2OG-Fe(II) oxygenase [Polaribacter batillariae]QTD37032.1 2OG-Fe(II) oxygenase [Polaribacter batillariae]